MDGNVKNLIATRHCPVSSHRHSTVQLHQLKQLGTTSKAGQQHLRVYSVEMAILASHIAYGLKPRNAGEFPTNEGRFPSEVYDTI